MLILSRYGQGSLSYGYLTVGVADSVVSSRSTIRSNGVLAYVTCRSVLAGVSQVADNRLVILVLPAAIGSGIGRNSVTVDDVLVIGCDHQVSLGNGYLTVGVADFVVGSRSTARSDDVLAYVARRSISAGVNQTAYYRFVIAVLPAAVCSGVLRNSITVDDVFVIGCDHQGCLVNGYLTVDISEGVVGGRSTARNDRVLAYVARRSVFAGVNQTTYNRCTVGVLEAAIGSGVGWNSIAVGDGLVLSRNGEECLSNSYLTVDEGDGIVSSIYTTRSDGIFAYVARRSVRGSECDVTGQH